MCSNRPNKSLYCLLRRRHVAATPEEEIRQNLLHFMLEERGFPRGLLAVEVSLKNLAMGSLSSRRIDIACYTPSLSGGLSTLLLIECKAVAITAQTLRQAASYNYFLTAPFLTLANATGIYTGTFDKALRHYRFDVGLPSYSDLLKAASG